MTAGKAVSNKGDQCDREEKCNYIFSTLPYLKAVVRSLLYLYDRPIQNSE